MVFWWGYSFYEFMISIVGEFCVLLYILDGVLGVVCLFLSVCMFVMCICVGSVDNNVY